VHRAGWTRSTHQLEMSGQKRQYPGVAGAGLDRDQCVQAPRRSVAKFSP
jgi:hypothetical protein